MKGPLWYRVALPIVAPLVSHWQRRRYQRLKDSAELFENRLGYAPEDTTGPLIWLHAASVGEVKSVRLLVVALLDKLPSRRVLVTVNTDTAHAEVTGWQHPRVIVQYAPLDTPKPLRRFLAHWQPQVFLNVEAEFWPLRFIDLHRAGVPIVLINARLSDKMLGRIRRLRFEDLVAGTVHHAFVQNVETAEGLEALGLPEDRISQLGNLKSIVHQPDRPLPKRDPLAMLAASTHEGEEAQVLDAFANARTTNLGLTLTLAPRHPDRAVEVAELVRTAGLTAALASAGAVATSDTVLIEDRLGHMAEHYARSAICFVGGSLVDKGGHTPYEPAHFGCNLISGGYVSNFAQEYMSMIRAGVCAPVRDSAELAAAINTTLERPHTQSAIAAALATISDPDAVFGEIIDCIETALKDPR